MADGKINIRKGRMEDLDVLAEIEVQGFPIGEAASKGVLMARLEVFANHFLVAEYEGAVVGFVNGFVSNSMVIQDEMYENPGLHDENGDYQMVFGLNVRRGYRGMGIAKRLMDEMAFLSEKEGRKGIALTCKEELVSFYEKLGFYKLGTSKSVHGGAVWYDMVQNLSLTP